MASAMTRTYLLGVWLALLCVLVSSQTSSPTSAPDATQQKLANIELGLNSAWLLITGITVFMMQAGFAILEAGAVSKRDTRNILFKNLLDICCTGLGWWGFGFAFAFGDNHHSGRGFIGGRYFFASHFPNEATGIGYAFWFFEFCFCAASCTIVSGAIAERATFQVYILWSLICSVWVYPVVAHWVWSPQGWLSATNPNGLLDIGMIDFAGCSVVHMVGGGGALVASIMAGYRNKRSKVATYKPRFEKVGERWLVNDIPGRSDIFASLGVILLWFAWYGFNCGSTLAIASANTANTASRVAVTTTLSACAAGLTCVILGRALGSTGKFNINDANNGILAGLVSITAACAVVEPWAAVIIGFFGAIFFKFGAFCLLKLRIDDPVDASPLHLGCGIWGLLSTGIFAHKDHMLEAYGHNEHYGLFMGGGGRQLGAQFIGVIVVAAWTIFWAALFWIPAKILDKKRQDKIFFIDEDVTGGVDQRFISIALTKDLHNTLANIGTELSSEGSLNDVRVEMDHPGGIGRADSSLERDREKEELWRALTLNPGKRRAFLEFLASLPDDEEDLPRSSSHHSSTHHSSSGKRIDRSTGGAGSASGSGRGSKRNSTQVSAPATGERPSGVGANVSSNVNANVSSGGNNNSNHNSRH